jgi:hypothetical protein
MNDQHGSPSWSDSIFWKAFVSFQNFKISSSWAEKSTFGGTALKGIVVLLKG